MEAHQREGETFSETLERLISDYDELDLADGLDWGKQDAEEAKRAAKKSKEADIEKSKDIPPADEL
ncbi:hypothetical protein BRD17_00185 [Halobacteriales archaeon SW_7_68_16]|nr:MAG: hypothetical protein BRD17_00185 [Halobacteriales archaeon SW_7_68_16]